MARSLCQIPDLTADEVPHVMAGAEARDGVQELQLEEIWRRGGEDDGGQDAQGQPAAPSKPGGHQLEGGWVDTGQKETGRKAERNTHDRTAGDSHQGIGCCRPDRTAKDHMPRCDNIG